MPSVSAVPGMSSTPSISSISHFSVPGRTGAKPTPQLPVTTRRDAVAAGRLQQAVPADLAVVVGVDVDETRRHHLPCRVDGFGRFTAQLRVAGAAAHHVDDLAVLDADVGLVALGARAVDDGATGDLEVEHEFPPSLCGVAMGWLVVTVDAGPTITLRLVP